MKQGAKHISEPNISKVIEFLMLFMPITIAKRIVCIILLSIGISIEEVSQISGFCKKTVASIKMKLDANEISALFVIGGGGRKSPLADFESAIVKEVNENAYHTKQQIADMILERYGIKITPQAVGKLLKKNEIRLLKCGSLPMKADTAKQRDFYDKTLHPLMKQAISGAVELFFVDASHFVMGCDYISSVYGIARRWIQTGSGRKRYNVLGALNFVSKKITTITNATYITSIQVCELLKNLAVEYAGKTICLVLDNASYQKCYLVREMAAELGITLIFIPPYSPNLNLIERFWKFTKAKLRTKYYTQFDEFTNRIDAIVGSSDGAYKNDVDRLITENVQLFDCPEITKKNVYPILRAKSSLKTAT
jgi:transposase